MGEYNLELLSTLWEGREAGITLLKEAFTNLFFFPFQFFVKRRIRIWFLFLISALDEETETNFKQICKN